MSQIRIKAINTQSTHSHSAPSFEEFAVILFSLAIGALLVLLCVGDVVAAIGLLVLLVLALMACAAVAGILYFGMNILKKTNRR